MLRNKNFWTNKKDQKGVTLLLAILILSAVMSISFSLTSILFIELRSSSDLLKTESSLYGATGVGEQALFHLKRASCPTNNPNCYYSQFENSVNMVGDPELVAVNNPIFTDKVRAYSTFNTTSSIYEFCPTTPSYSGQTIQGCGYGRVTMNYIFTGSTNSIYAYLCEWDPNATFSELPCSDTTSIIHTNWQWLNPCTTSCAGGAAQGTGSQNSDGSVLLNPGTSNTVTWDLDHNKQQQLIIVNLNTSSDVYFSVASYDADNVTPKGLPFVGSTSINITTNSGQAGRKIRVTVPNTSGGAAVDTNVALGRTASQSSTYATAGAAFAVDGNTDGDWASGSVSHTLNDLYAWWQVDLGSTKTISSVNVYNRTDCCQSRMSDYWIFISDTPFTALETPATLQTRPNTWNNHQTTYPNPSTAIPFASVTGQYVRLQLGVSDYLNMAELQVMGH